MYTPTWLIVLLLLCSAFADDTQQHGTTTSLTLSVLDASGNQLSSGSEVEAGTQISFKVQSSASLNEQTVLIIVAESPNENGASCLLSGTECTTELVNAAGSGLLTYNAFILGNDDVEFSQSENFTIKVRGGFASTLTLDPYPHETVFSVGGVETLLFYDVTERSSVDFVVRGTASNTPSPSTCVGYSNGSEFARASFSNGACTVTLTFSKTSNFGTNNIEVVTLGDSNHAETRKQISIKIIERVDASSAITFEVTPQFGTNEFFAGERVTLTATIASGSPVPNVPIVFLTETYAILGGCHTFLLDASNQYTCAILSTEELALTHGTHSVTARFSSDYFYEDYASIKTFTVNKLPISLVPSVMSPYINDASIHLDVVCTASQACAELSHLWEGEITVDGSNASGMETAPMQVNSDNIATYLIDASKMSLGSYSAVFKYDGDDIFESAEASLPFDIIIYTPTISVDFVDHSSAVYSAGESIRIVVSLQTHYGNHPLLPHKDVEGSVSVRLDTNLVGQCEIALGHSSCEVIFFSDVTPGSYRMKVDFESRTADAESVSSELDFTLIDGSPAPPTDAPVSPTDAPAASSDAAGASSSASAVPEAALTITVENSIVGNPDTFQLQAYSDAIAQKFSGSTVNSHIVVSQKRAEDVAFTVFSDVVFANQEDAAPVTVDSVTAAINSEEVSAILATSSAKSTGVKATVTQSSDPSKMAEGSQEGEKSINSPSKVRSDKLSGGAIAGIVIGAGAFVAMALAAVVYKSKRTSASKSNIDSSSSAESSL